MISSVFQLPVRTVAPLSSIRDTAAETGASAAGTLLLNAASARVDEALKAGDAIGALVVLARKVDRAGTVYEVFNAISAYAANDAGGFPAAEADGADSGP